MPEKSLSVRFEISDRFPFDPTPQKIAIAGDAPL
jgi:hypothetical protein